MKSPSYPTSIISCYLEGDPPIQVGHSVGHLYVGSLGGVTGVGGVLTKCGRIREFVAAICKTS